MERTERRASHTMQAGSPFRILLVTMLMLVPAHSSQAIEPGTDTEVTTGSSATEATEATDFFAPSMIDMQDFLAGTELGEMESEELFEGIAAQVGSGVVLVSEVRRLASPVEARMRKAGAPRAEILAMRASALDRLIESRLIEDVVERAQLSASEQEINSAIAGIASENGLTLDQMQDSITSHGLSIEEYRAKLKSEIERSKVLNSMVRSRVRVEDEELEAAYLKRFAKQRGSGTEAHLRHLLIGVVAGERDREDACRLAREIRAQIASGAMTFQEAARQHSDANAQQGGDLGWVHLSELASWMAPAIEALEPGGLSDVISMYFGCNILELVDRREFRPVSFLQAKPRLEEALFRQKMDEEYIRWIDKIRQQVYVQKKGIYAESSRLRARSTGP